MKSLTEWGLVFAVAHNLEVRAGNEGEVGPPRGFSLHVRGLRQGQVFRFDPEGKPRRLLTWLPVIEAVSDLPHPAELHEDGCFKPVTPPEGYHALRYTGGDRQALESVLLTIIDRTVQHAVPVLGADVLE